MTPLLPQVDESETKPITSVLQNTVPPRKSDGFALPGAILCVAARLRSLSARAALLLLCLGLLYLFGCGSASTLAFDGGGFPIGGRVYGIVVAAERPSAAVANATVSVQSIAPNGETQTLQAVTDIHGQFDFHVVPLSSPIGKLKLSVVPRDGSDRNIQNLSFGVANGQTVDLVVALPPKTLDQTTAASVTLLPQYIQANSVDQVPIQASLLNIAGQPITVMPSDGTGQPLPVMPSLLFIGGFGSIGSDGGSFHSNYGGSATLNSALTALFDAGPNRQLQVSNTVSISPTTDPHPPLPPVTPSPPLDTEPPSEKPPVKSGGKPSFK